MDKLVTLTSTIVLQMLGDTVFYRRNPIYLFMMDNGLAISRQFAELQRKQQQCKGCTERAIHGSLATFAMHTRLAARFDPSLLMPLVEYLGERMGFKATAVNLYYKDSSQAQRELRFGPGVPGLVSDALVEQGGSHAAVHSSTPVGSSQAGSS